MNASIPKPGIAAVGAGIILVVILGWLTTELLGARTEIDRQQSDRSAAETAREAAENEAAGLRVQVVRFKAELDQQSALLTGQVSPQELWRLEEELEATRTRAGQLEARVATTDEPAAEGESVAEGEAGSEQPPSEEEGGRRDRGRAPDPERMAEMQRQREEFVGRARGLLGERLSGYADRAAAAETKEEAAVASKIADTLQQMDAIMAQSGQEMSWEDRRQSFGVMREHMQALGPLMEQDRQVRLQGLARQIGYDDSASSEQFVDYVRQIYEDTSFDPRQMFGGGGPGGRGRGR